MYDLLMTLDNQTAVIAPGLSFEWCMLSLEVKRALAELISLPATFSCKEGTLA